MLLINDNATDAVTEAPGQAQHGLDENSAFRFLPSELAVKCRKLVESYHAMHGYGRLPDMLWHSDARDIIECNRELAQIFKAASRSRCAKRADDLFLLIATVIASIEALARDFAGWGKRFPAAKREAEELLIDFPQRRRTWFMDKYLYPSLDVHRDVTGALSVASADTTVVGN